MVATATAIVASCRSTRTVSFAKDAAGSFANAALAAATFFDNDVVAQQIVTPGYARCCARSPGATICRRSAAG